MLEIGIIIVPVFVFHEVNMKRHYRNRDYIVKITCLESCGRCNSCHSNLSFSKPIFLPVLLLLFFSR